MKRLALAALLLAGGCSTALTPSDLAPSFTRTFTGLYLQQQALLGRSDLTRAALVPLASCRRSGGDPDGPGEDWVCSVQYVDGGRAASQVFEVQLKADGCWRADGAPAAQPVALTDARSGRAAPNPLAEFDGCLDSSFR